MTLIEYKKSVFEDLKKIRLPEARRIIKQLEKTLHENPHKGIPPKGECEGLFRLRIGDYRVIYTKTGKGVLILRIGRQCKIYT